MSEIDRYERQCKQLGPAQLLTEAQAAGISGFGDKRFVVPMTRYLDRAAREVNFSVEGLAGFRGDILRHLVNRLRTQEDIKRHPEILEEDVSDPIIIIGIPRTGTTKMQRMLAAGGGQCGGRPWILKSVSHISHMDVLLECFPNATLVHCHRDPRTTIPSVAKLMFEIWSTKANLDKKFVGQNFA